MRATILAILLLLAPPAAAATVSLDHGNILVDGRAVTSGGHDSDPALSPDGKTIAFSRTGDASPAMRNCSLDGSGPVAAVALWIIDVDGGHPRKLLDGRAADKPEAMLCDFSAKAFDSSGRLLYFDTPAWATSGATHVIDLRTGREKLFVAGDLVRVLAACTDKTYRDDVIATQHRYFVFGGSYDWAYLFTPDGKEVGPLGDDTGDMTMVDDACSD